MPGPHSTDPALLQRLSAARVLELTPDIAIVTDLDGIILYGNRALERRVGIPIEQLIGRPTSDVLHPEDLASAAPAWQALVAGETDGAEFALRFGSPETGWRWCLGSAGIDRETGVSIGTYQQTTALRDAEERFQRAFEDAGDRHGDHRHRRALRARQPLAGGDAGLRAATARRGRRARRHPRRAPRERRARRCARSRPAS